MCNCILYKYGLGLGYKNACGCSVRILLKKTPVNVFYNPGITLAQRTRPHVPLRSTRCRRCNFPRPLGRPARRSRQRARGRYDNSRKKRPSSPRLRLLDTMASASPIDLGAWAAVTQRLLNLEWLAEREELEAQLRELSPSEAQTAGLSLISLRVTGRTSALFGRTKFTVRGLLPMRCGACLFLMFAPPPSCVVDLFVCFSSVGETGRCCRRTVSDLGARLH